MFSHQRAPIARRSKRIAALTAAAVSLTLTGVGVARVGASSPSPGSTDTTPFGGANANGLTVPDSAFAVPAGARFVAPTGSDSNPGTVDAPFQTIAHAVSASPAGSTIVVRSGTYRETLGHLSKRLTIEAYPHEQVWMKGSVVVSDFAAAGATWVKTGWQPQLCHACYPGSALDPAHRAAGLPDQVFVDGQPLEQVTSAGAVVPGTFYVDVANHRLVLGTDPTGHVVEATYYAIAMQFDGRASGSRLLGIGVMEYGPHFNFDQPAMVIGNATNLTFDHDAFDWSATRGLTVYRPGAVVEHSDFLYDGANGFHANRADGLIVMHDRFVGANAEQFSIASSATASLAAMKVTATKYAVVKWNSFEHNAATAVWFDLSAYNVTIADNVISHSDGFGIMYEVSSRGVIDGNVVTSSGRDGIRISGSTNTQITGNTLVGNAWSQLGVYEDPRTQHDPRLRQLGITWDTANITAHGNVFAAGSGNSAPLFNSFDASHPRHRTTLQMLASDGDNVFVQPPAAKAGDPIAAWQVTLRSTTRWPTLAALQHATGHERGSRTTANLPPSAAAAVSQAG